MMQNNSVNFQSKNAAIREKVIRCKRVYYPKDEKPLWKDLFGKFTKGFVRKENSTYNIFGDKKTVYYNYKGKVMATVYDIEGKNKRMILSTPKRDYTDFGKTGVVNYFDEDQEVVVNKAARSSNYIEGQAKQRFLYGFNLNRNRLK